MKLEYTCDQFQSNLHKFWQADEYRDVILIDANGTTRIPAHRVVLAASSTYFAEQTLDMDMDGNIIKEIVVAAIDGVTLQQLVDVCYSGTIEVDDNNVSSVYEGAVHLQFNDLLTKMEDYIVKQLNNANCLHFHHLADAFSRSEFLDATKNYICSHFIEISDQPSFLELDAKNLKSLLDLEGLQLPSAEDLFPNVMKWIQHDPERQRDNVLLELLPHLRLSLMSSKFLLTIVQPHCKTVETNALIFAALETQLESIPDVSTPKLAKQLDPIPTVSAPKLTTQFECIPPVPTVVKRLPVQVEVGRKQLIVVKGDLLKSCSIVEYSFERKNWNILADLPVDLQNYSVIHSKALNSLCFVGGQYNYGAVSAVLLWNLKTRIFTKATNMLEPRCWPGITFMKDDKDGEGDLIVVGGSNGRTEIKTVERWSHKAVEWHSVVPTKQNKRGARLVTIGSLIYCIGGWNHNTRLNSVECYNSTEMCWKTVAPFRHARGFCGTLVDGGKIYIIGGYSNVIESYDPEKDQWTEVCTLECSGYVTTCIRHNNRLYAFGLNIALTSNGDWKKWKISNLIEPFGDYIYGAFSIPRQ